MRSQSFETRATWGGGAYGELSSGDRPLLSFSAPVSFGGVADAWTPAHLMVGAVESSAMLTFLSICGRKGIAVLGYASRASAHFAMEADGSFNLEELIIRPSVHLRSEDDVERALRALDEVLDHPWFLGGTLPCEVSIEPVSVIAPELSRGAPQPAGR